jgi:hypothetical protein
VNGVNGAGSPPACSRPSFCPRAYDSCPKDAIWTVSFELAYNVHAPGRADAARRGFCGEGGIPDAEPSRLRRGFTPPSVGPAGPEKTCRLRDLQKGPWDERVRDACHVTPSRAFRALVRTPGLSVPRSTLDQHARLSV